MKWIALAAIRIYQRILSPLKGYACAYRVHTGRASCSWVGLRAVRRFGLWRGIGILRLRLEKCGVAHRRFGRRPAPRTAFRHQAGFCDLPCDLPCDFSGVGDAAGSAFDCLGDCGTGLSPCDCCDGWTRRKKRDEESEKNVYIPPKAKPARSEPPAVADKPRDGDSPGA